MSWLSSDIQRPKANNTHTFSTTASSSLVLRIYWIAIVTLLVVVCTPESGYCEASGS